MSFTWGGDNFLWWGDCYTWRVIRGWLIDYYMLSCCGTEFNTEKTHISSLQSDVTECHDYISNTKICARLWDGSETFGKHQHSKQCFSYRSIKARSPSLNKFTYLTHKLYTRFRDTTSTGEQLLVSLCLLLPSRKPNETIQFLGRSRKMSFFL